MYRLAKGRPRQQASKAGQAAAPGQNLNGFRKGKQAKCAEPLHSDFFKVMAKMVFILANQKTRFRLMQGSKEPLN